MDANLLSDSNKQVVNVTIHIIKRADRNTKLLQQAIETTEIFQENPVTMKLWESDYGTAAKELSLVNLHSAINKMTAIPKANLDDELTEEMETDQTNDPATIPGKRVETQPAIRREPGITIPIDEGTLEGITKEILREKEILNKREAGRIAFLRKKEKKKKKKKGDKVHQDEPHEIAILESTETLEEKGAAVSQQHS
ncbi:hypothetical protein JTB14_033319 [Gonioctena quinquepunctata]|nr:hypothetical protein JTB14_033319 [Gonioctena quinquepunctata]